MSSKMMRFFTTEVFGSMIHGPEILVNELAEVVDDMLPETSEKTAGLRKLLEARDCFARAYSDPLDKSPRKSLWADEKLFDGEGGE